MNEEETEKMKLVHADIISAMQDLNEIDFPANPWIQGKRRLIQVALATARLRVEGILEEDGKHSTI